MSSPSPVNESTQTILSDHGSPNKHGQLKDGEVLKLQFAKLSNKAHPPTKNSTNGLDLKSAYPYTVPKRGSCLVKTDIQVKLPKGACLALKSKVDATTAAINHGHRGNVGIFLFNLGEGDFHIGEGEVVAQLICNLIERSEIEEIPVMKDI